MQSTLLHYGDMTYVILIPFEMFYRPTTTTVYTDGTCAKKMVNCYIYVFSSFFNIKFMRNVTCNLWHLSVLSHLISHKKVFSIRVNFCSF